MEEPVSHGLMQKPWQLRPQVASNVHLVRLAMSGGLIRISLKWRPLIYKHQTVLPTNCLITMPQAINVGDCVPGVDWIIDTCWCGPDLLEKLWQDKVQHGRDLLAADEQRAATECARSLPFLSSNGLQFCWGNVHQLVWAKIHHPGWRLCSEIFSIMFTKVTRVKIGQNKKPPRGDNILGEETQKEYGKKKGLIQNISSLDFLVMTGLCLEN